ncbi:MAG: protein-glutamate O-methyltransferase CheR [Dehalococcoidia bacterium]|nr:protein-glutamate O-methyltransferase CheR [Chloroflexi bacterium CFX7]MCK6563974.1 protein-glutamate O-methyltransferase CheR [Dehalococcoidia bacterium]NUQ54952.1 protein-glutamate O-methyltransferase CheR [Dehalococcoidia bacterium]
MTQAPEDRAWLSFRATLEKAIGVPLSQYKEPQMKRRLASIMTRRGLGNWPEFATAIAADMQLLIDVRDTLTINVSEFFRQPERFADLERAHLPRLLKENRKLKIWSAGCSIGCEPYTLAMILNEIDPTGGHSIIATDVDMPVLNRAREGKGYHPAEVRATPAHYLKKYFINEGQTYAVRDEIRRKVTFRRHDLLSDPYPQDLDLILCRNVVIYFTDQAKAQIYSGFGNALRPGGLLFVGGSEMIMRSHDMGFRAAGTSMYQRAA